MSASIKSKKPLSKPARFIIAATVMAAAGYFVLYGLGVVGAVVFP